MRRCLQLLNAKELLAWLIMLVTVENCAITDKQSLKVETICVNAAECMIYLQNIPVDVDNKNTSH